MCLAIDLAARTWTIPMLDWQLAIARFIIEFPERLQQFIEFAVLPFLNFPHFYASIS